MNKLMQNWNKSLRKRKSKFRVLTETSFSKVAMDYGKLGYIIITSDRACEAEIKVAACLDNFGYLPVFVGNKETIKGPDTDSPENSIIIALRSESDAGSYLLSGEVGGAGGNTLKDLKNFGMKMAKKYNQDSFFYKPPNDIDANAYYLDRHGNITNTFTNFTVNDLKESVNRQMYFRVRTWPFGRQGATDARNRRGEFVVTDNGLNEG